MRSWVRATGVVPTQTRAEAQRHFLPEQTTSQKESFARAEQAYKTLSHNNGGHSVHSPMQLPASKKLSAHGTAFKVTHNGSEG